MGSSRDRMIVACAVLALLAAPAVAQERIYSWRDARGVLVLSDRPPDGQAVTYPVDPGATVLVTRPLAREAASYEHLIGRHARQQGVRPELVRAVIQVESGFDPKAVSTKGAMGLMQLMPGTAADLGVVDPFDPAENIKAGTAYLRALLARYGGNEDLALAAYNAGPGAVDRYGTQVPPYAETRRYLSEVRTVTDPVRPGSRSLIYKTYEVVNGRRIPRYTNTRPASGDYQVVGSAGSAR